MNSAFWWSASSFACRRLGNNAGERCQHRDLFKDKISFRACGSRILQVAEENEAVAYLPSSTAGDTTLKDTKPRHCTLKIDLVVPSLRSNKSAAEDLVHTRRLRTSYTPGGRERREYMVCGRGAKSRWGKILPCNSEFQHQAGTVAKTVNTSRHFLKEMRRFLSRIDRPKRKCKKTFTQ